MKSDPTLLNRSVQCIIPSAASPHLSRSNAGLAVQFNDFDVPGK
jgi:hypothetical protein